MWYIIICKDTLEEACLCDVDLPLLAPPNRISIQKFPQRRKLWVSMNLFQQSIAPANLLQRMAIMSKIIVCIRKINFLFLWKIMVRLLSARERSI